MVFRDIVIPVGGKDYTVTPSNRLLRTIEAKARKIDPDFSLVKVAIKAQLSQGHMYDMAFLLAELVNGCGGAVTEEDALAEFMAFDAQHVEDMAAYMNLIASCVMPEVSEKKPDAGA